MKEEQAQIPNVDSSVLLAEYSALRAEALKRIEIQNQLVQLTLTLAGVSYTIGLQTATIQQVAVAVLLVYPIITMFLTAGWVHNARRMSRINHYIRENLGKHLQGLGWEKYLHSRDGSDTEPSVKSIWQSLRSYNTTYVFGIFFGSQFLAILLVLFRFSTLTIQELVLLAVAVTSVAGTFYLLVSYVVRFERDI